jgi:hypothetical protein
VFVDVLPELGARHLAFVRSAGKGLLFAEQRISLAALLAFVVLYGLDHIVLTARERAGATPTRAMPSSGSTSEASRSIAG